MLGTVVMHTLICYMLMLISLIMIMVFIVTITRATLVFDRRTHMGSNLFTNIIRVCMPKITHFHILIQGIITFVPIISNEGTIIKYAQENGVDVIIVGTKGTSGCSK
jgi:hypothetical protein